MSQFLFLRYGVAKRLDFLDYRAIEEEYDVTQGGISSVCQTFSDDEKQGKGSPTLLSLPPPARSVPAFASLGRRDSNWLSTWALGWTDLAEVDRPGWAAWPDNLCAV